MGYSDNKDSAVPVFKKLPIMSHVLKVSECIMNFITIAVIINDF